MAEAKNVNNGMGSSIGKRKRTIPAQDSMDHVNNGKHVTSDDATDTGIPSDDMQWIGKKKARVRCGNCEACTRLDCGKCMWCVKKRKFGGKGKSKQACLYRRCNNLQQRPPRELHLTATLPTGEESLAENSPSEALRMEIRAPFEPTLRPPPKLLVEPNDLVAGIGTGKSISTMTLGSDMNPNHRYGIKIPSEYSEVCCGCRGARDKEAGDEPILLCDGLGCSNEFHLGCCIPPLLDVPEGSYYCIDCSHKGSTSSLEAYLEDHDGRRADHRSSVDYHAWLLKQELDENALSPPKSPRKEEQIPRSELCRIAEVQVLLDKSKDLPKSSYKANGNGKVPKQRRLAKQNKEDSSSLGPDFLIGKPIRLFCPYDNTYHCGRIVDYRCTMKEEIKESSLTFLLSVSMAITSDYEFLVRFPAGKDYRKKTLYHWIRLEEHSLALGAYLIWGKYKSFEPAMVLLRTTRELMPVKHMLREEVGEIIYPSTPTTKSTRVWALAKRFGEEDGYKLLHMQEEAVDLFSPQQPTPHTRNKILYSLAMAEWYEQQRVIKWRSMKLHSPVGPKVLRALDEYPLEPLGQVKEESLCQLVPQGLDRSYLMNLLQRRNLVDPSKDIAASLDCHFLNK